MGLSVLKPGSPGQIKMVGDCMIRQRDRKVMGTRQCGGRQTALGTKGSHPWGKLATFCSAKLKIPQKGNSPVNRNIAIKTKAQIQT